MSLLVDLFGYLSVVIHGLTIVAQSLAVGSVIFLVALARPSAAALAGAGTSILFDTRRVALWSALALVVCEAATIALQAAVLVGTVDLSLGEALGASSAVAGLVKIAAAAALVVLVTRETPGWLLLLLCFVELAAATMTTHAVARLDGRLILIAAAFLHQLGAAIWIGGIPTFIMALSRVQERAGWAIVGARFSRLSQIGVACIIVSAAAFTWLYIGAPEAVYGTAYGVMVAAKTIMFAALLLLGFANARTVARLQAGSDASLIRMKRYAEVEVGVGLALFFAAASLTSVPPAVDLSEDRVTMAEIVERNTPVWPRMNSPEHDTLTIVALQAKLDAEVEASRAKPQAAFTPGSGELPERNAADIAWSEYNHHWAGVFVAIIGLLALVNQAGVRWARHWPLMFLVPAVFLAVRADPEAWPLGSIGFWESFRDTETLQHRFFVVLIMVLAFFEWRVRAGGWQNSRAALVFPLVTLLGGIALLTHSHAIANVKDALLIELTHTPLALAGVGAGAARWLELRLPGRGGRVAGWIWPLLFVFIGLLLINYRET